MRPVFKGRSTPTFTSHGSARSPLENTLGAYCSYCEAPIRGAGGSVEHILPQKNFPGYILSWNNFLLACTSCNSVKRWMADKWTNQTDADNCYWPHRDNTFRLFFCDNTGKVGLRPNLCTKWQKRAKNTLELTGLDRVGTTATERDFRWRDRREAWRIAEIQRTCLTKHDNPQTRDSIIIIAKQIGFWSVWMTVFSADNDMKARLISAFPGTCTDSFDKKGNERKRKGGRL